MSPTASSKPREVTETEFHLLVTEADLVDLSAGYVNHTVKSLARTLLDFELDDERRAAANLAQIAHRNKKALTPARRRV